MADKKKKRYYKPEMERRFNEEGMIREDRSAIANLPQNVIMREYPRYGNGYEGGMLNDKLSGIDRQMEMDDNQMMRRVKPKKV